MKTKIRYLNHCDICNEIEQRLELIDSEGNKLKSENTTFEVKFTEYPDEGELIVTIKKEEV